MKTRFQIAGVLVSVATTVVRVDAAPSDPTLVVQADQPGATPMQVGVFFEDINCGADGGLYPERVKNRSFEFPEPLMGWQLYSRGASRAKVTVESEAPLNANNPHYLHVVGEANDAGIGLVAADVSPLHRSQRELRSAAAGRRACLWSPISSM